MNANYAAEWVVVVIAAICIVGLFLQRNKEPGNTKIIEIGFDCWKSKTPAPISEPVKLPPPDWMPKWVALKEAYPVGRRFEYLGLRMIVKTHVEYFAGFYDFPWFVAPAMPPAIVAEYADGNGVIHEHTFATVPWKFLEM